MPRAHEIMNFFRKILLTGQNRGASDSRPRSDEPLETAKVGDCLQSDSVDLSRFTTRDAENVLRGLGWSRKEAAGSAKTLMNILKGITNEQSNH